MSEPLRSDPEEIRRALAALVEPESVVELRALRVPNGRWSNVVSGYFDDLNALACEAARLSDTRERGAST